MNAIDRASALLKKSQRDGLNKRPPNSFTRREYAERTGLTVKGADKQLGRLCALKKLKKIKFPQIDKLGRVHMQYGYQLVEEK